MMFGGQYLITFYNVKMQIIFFTWSSIVISVPRVLSVFHFSVKVRPYSDLLYFVSRVPATLLVSVLEEPDVLNSWKLILEKQSEDKPKDKLLGKKD